MYLDQGSTSQETISQMKANMCCLRMCLPDSESSSMEEDFPLLTSLLDVPLVLMSRCSPWTWQLQKSIGVWPIRHKERNESIYIKVIWKTETLCRTNWRHQRAIKKLGMTSLFFYFLLIKFIYTVHFFFLSLCMFLILMILLEVKKEQH